MEFIACHQEPMDNTKKLFSIKDANSLCIMCFQFTALPMPLFFCRMAQDITSENPFFPTNFAKTM